MADVETDLLKGLAQDLEDASCGTYKADGGYTASETAIVFGGLPTSPHRAIALTLYGADDEGSVPLSSLRLQVMVRGNPNDALDAGEVAGAIFTFLQGLQHRQYGSAHLTLAQRISRITLGADESKRQIRSDNYALDVDMPATAGRPG